MANKPHVLVAGAGMGGLTAALALLRKGFDCDVYEQAPELKELGAGLWISANGARVLFGLGLKEEISRINLPPEDRVIRLWNTGQTWSVYSRKLASEADHTLYMVLRAELHRILWEAVRRLKPDAIHLNARCTGFVQDGDRVRMALADGSSATGDVLIGADGAHSRVRQTAFGPAPARYTNALAWRGLVPVERLSPQHRRPVASTWVGPTAHVTCYPVRRGDSEMVSFSCQVERSGWQVESWSEVGTLEECLADFAGWHDDILQLLRNAETLYKWGIFVRDLLPAWSTGRVSLLGDACHSMVPYLGMGVNMAMEDAGVLARCLEKYEPERALQQYQAARLERAALAVQRSADMQYTFHNPALGGDGAAAYVDATWHPDKVKARYDWLLAYDADTVPV